MPAEIIACTVRPTTEAAPIFNAAAPASPPLINALATVGDDSVVPVAASFAKSNVTNFDSAGVFAGRLNMVYPFAMNLRRDTTEPWRDSD